MCIYNSIYIYVYDIYITGKNNIERVPYITEDLPYTIILKKKKKLQDLQGLGANVN